jgi:hypothetical protein
MKTKSLLLASVALLTASTHAQDATTNAPPASVPADASASSQAPAKPSFSDRLPDLRVGPFDIHPRLTTGVMYDDNILISSHNTRSDFIWSVNPAASIVAGDRMAITEYLLNNNDFMGISPSTYITSGPEVWPGKLLMLDYGPRFNWFTDYSENNSTDQLLKFDALLPMAKLILGVNQGYTRENTGVIEASRRANVETITSSIMGAYQFSEKTSAEMNLRRISTDYEANQGLNGQTDWSDANWFNYQMTPLITEHGRWGA